MRELLERWSRLEPERCGISEHAVHLGTPFAFRIHWAMLDAYPVNRAVLLAAVIEAIEARGWYWACTSIGGSSLRAYRVAVDHTVHHGDYDAPLTAMLLGAYLAALEAEEGAQ